MNIDKIKEVLQQLDIAIEAINEENMPELNNEDLDYDGFDCSLTGSSVYNRISTAYQLLDGISYELTDILENE